MGNSIILTFEVFGGLPPAFHWIANPEGAATKTIKTLQDVDPSGFMI